MSRIVRSSSIDITIHESRLTPRHINHIKRLLRLRWAYLIILFTMSITGATYFDTDTMQEYFNTSLLEDDEQSNPISRLHPSFLEDLPTPPLFADSSTNTGSGNKRTAKVGIKLFCCASNDLPWILDVQQPQTSSCDLQPCCTADRTSWQSQHRTLQTSIRNNGYEQRRCPVYQRQELFS